MTETTADKSGEGVREKADVKLADFLDAPIKTTGSDIPDGSYPAILYGFGEPFKVPVAEQFKKEGQPTKRVVFELNFCILDKSGTPQHLGYMVPIPDGGEVNRKSNLFKALKNLAGGDKALIKDDGTLADGITLKSFIGRTCILNVKKNKKDWPAVESLVQPMAGAKYPSLEEAKKAQAEASEGVPF